ncbi:MAG: hypothetical protein J6J70_00625, partial [Methanocorpusculaceae archaeon]|nr:hypothetical protein [Methanocorpusculaceae archaeon]
MGIRIIGDGNKVNTGAVILAILGIIVCAILIIGVYYYPIVEDKIEQDKLTAEAILPTLKDPILKRDFSAAESSALHETLYVDSSYNSVHIVGLNGKVYTDFSIVVSPRTTDLIIQLENFNFVAPAGQSAIDASSLSGATCTLYAVGHSSVTGGAGVNSDGAPGIVGGNIEVIGNGYLQVYGGNGAAGSNGYAGADGGNGYAGGVGISATNLINKLASLSVTGGDGGRGGNGGDGLNGWDGVDGRDAYKGGVFWGNGYKYGDDGTPGSDG